MMAVAHTSMEIMKVQQDSDRIAGRLKTSFHLIDEISSIMTMYISMSDWLAISSCEVWNLAFFTYSHFGVKLSVTAALQPLSNSFNDGHVESCIWMVNDCLDPYAFVRSLDDWLSR